ncbi:MAG: hypothetical protein JXX14_06465 [Deltaproteobacteria bacterium]|nr:hypothetical protein [Deltaproteobacteria bacterium]
MSSGTRTIPVASVVLICMAFSLAACSASENIGYWDRPNPDNEKTDTQPQTDSGAQETEAPPQTDSAIGDSATEDTNTATQFPVDSASDSDTQADSVTVTETADTESTDTAATDSDTADSDVGIVRVPFSPDPQAIIPMLRVNAADNVLGQPGGWYHYDYSNEDGIAHQPYFDTDGNFCIKGEVAKWSDPYTVSTAGTYVAVCHDPDVDYTVYTITDCPYTEKSFQLLGASFYIKGAIIPATLKMRPIWKGQITLTADIDITGTAPVDYLFNALPDPWNVRQPLNDIHTIQIQVDGSPYDAVAYDFCITDFALLVSVN